MYRAPSPFSPEHQQRAPPYSTQVAPGQVTYTTSTGLDGRVIYHPFRAVAASYQTPNGVVSGIQWIPAEATMILPPGATPANSEFAASWSRNGISKDEEKALKEWQRDEDKRRKKEEKEAKRQREKEQRNAEADNELRKARERDAEARQRRSSFNQGAPNTMAFPAVGGPAAGGYSAVGATGYPAANPGYPATPAGYTATPATNPGYPATPYTTAGYNGVPAAAQTTYDPRDRKYSTGAGVSDLNRQFEDLGINQNQEHTGMTRPTRYHTEAERTRKVSSNLGGERPGYPPAGPYPPGAYPTPYPAQAPAGQYPPSQYAASSPNMRPGESPQAPYASSAYTANFPPAAPPMARPTTPYGGAPQFYPPGHVMDGKPTPRSTTPNPGAVAAPAGYQQPFPAGMQMPPDPNAADQGQLAAPEGFSRPVNAAQAFTPFEPMKIQDMDELIQNAPRMPAVLQPHDVYASDWNRMMQDLCLAWTGRLPAPGRTQKKSSLAADLIDLWNVSFFFSRGVEVVLYKGRERRTGPNAGLVDIQLPTYGDRDDDSSSSSSSSENSDSDSGTRYPPPTTYMYGQQPMVSMAEEQKRRRREIKAEKKRRRKEKKARRKAQQREKKYSLYLTCVPNGGPAVSGMSQPMGGNGMMPGAPMAAGAGYPAIPPTAGYGGPGVMGQPGYGAVGGGY